MCPCVMTMQLPDVSDADRLVEIVAELGKPGQQMGVGIAVTAAAVN